MDEACLIINACKHHGSIKGFEHPIKILRHFPFRAHLWITGISIWKSTFILYAVAIEPGVWCGLFYLSNDYKTNSNQIKRVCYSCKYHWKLIMLSLFNNGVFPFGELINILFPRDKCTMHKVSNHTLINHVTSSIRQVFPYGVNSKRGFVTLD